MSSLRETKAAKPKAEKPPLETNKDENYHHGDLKSTLLATAIEMLKTRSKNEISLRQLAREAGVSPAAPYRHFKEKDDLFAELMKQGFELQFRYMQAALKRQRNEPLDMFYHGAEAYFEMGQNHPELYKLMFNSGIQHDDLYPEVKLAAAQTFVILRNMIIHCQNEGLIYKGDPYLLSLQCWSIVHGYTSLYVNGCLAWLGVSKANALAGLQVLLQQFLQATSKPPVGAIPSFSLFQEADSFQYWQMMEAMSVDLD